jgi:pantoate--beta-alanine ligase
MLQIETIADLRAVCDRARAQGQRVGLVPTMGFLHEGHRSLMQAARATCDLVVVTIFVNPLQFGAGEDLDRYPRDLTGDLAQCEQEAVDVVFAPSVAEMYPSGPPVTRVHVDELTTDLCGAARPTHFDGVSTVVTKLFAISGACSAFFGRKDAQQLAVIERLVEDLNLPVEVVGCPIVREPDGLARSSRNAYLSPEQRRAAVVLSRSLRAVAGAVVAGERDASVLAGIVRDLVSGEPEVRLEYVEVRESRELAPVEVVDGEVLVALAAHLGETRLIDNVTLSVHGDDVRADLGQGATRVGTHSDPERASHGRHGSPVGGARERRVQRTMMKSKIHRATITGANLEYVGSITLDRTLMELADIREFEQVAVLDIDNGARFETYAMEGGPGDVILNGAAARLVQPGDRVIVITYAVYDESELASYAPLIVHVDEANRPIAADEAVQRAGSNLVWMRDHPTRHLG